MKDAAPQTIYLKDYQVAVFLIEKTNLVFDLGDDQTSVVTELSVLRNPSSKDQSKHLVLDGSIQLRLDDYLGCDHACIGNIKDRQRIRFFKIASGIQLLAIDLYPLKIKFGTTI